MKGYVVQKGARFYAVIYEGVDPLTGRERRRWHPAGTDRTVAEQLATELAARACSVDRSSGLTLATFLLRRWLPAKRVSLRPSTWDSYRRIVELHVVPLLGTVPLRRLRAQHLESLYTELLTNGRCDGRGGLDGKTVLEVHVIIRKALADARRKGLVVRNVADDAEAPKRRRPSNQLRAWNIQQLHGFLTSARSHRLFPAFWLAVTTGMRRSELLGLRWGDIDLDVGRLAINRALVSVAYELHDTPGKTRSSRRSVDLDPVTVEVLRAWHKRRSSEAGRQVGDDDRVFAAPSGAAIHPDVFSQTFNRIVAAAGVPAFDFTTSGTPMPRSCSKRACPSKSSANGSATPLPASPWPPTSTCFPACKPTRRGCSPASSLLPASTR